MAQQWFERHKNTLDKAQEAIRTRGYFSAYPEAPSGKIYGESAKDDAVAAFKALLNKPFDIDQPGNGQVGAEHSPYGFPLGITYPKPDLDAVMKAAQAAMLGSSTGGVSGGGWGGAAKEARAGVCLEILHRLNTRSFEVANMVMHTTGQGFVMAFQAGGPHAQDRALEAVAYTFDAMSRVPETVQWTKQVGKTETVNLRKRYHIVPRGISVVIGCSTFPTWNSYPALFASLVAGNAVVVKPHPGAILPLAFTVKIAREVIKEAGFDPNVIQLAADTADAPITKDIVMRPEVAIVDYTGGSEFGTWIEQNARHAQVFTEKAGVNSIILDSVENLDAVAANIAFTLCLYSGQMCTTSQNIFVPAGGIKAGAGYVSVDDVAKAIAAAVDGLMGEPKRAAEIGGAIQNQRTAKRITEAQSEGAQVVRASTPIANDVFPNARTSTPLILKTDASKTALFMREMFGPITYIVETDGPAQSIELATKCAKELGAITWAAYSTDDSVLANVEAAALNAGVALSCNLTGTIYVNQAAAFSDYHVAGCNPSGNATLCDDAYVAGRFRVVQTRVPQAPAAPPQSRTETPAHARV